jgi:hypothetical protein
MALHSLLPPNGGDRTWRLQLELTARYVDPMAVQWAIFATDPRPRYRAELARLTARQGAADAAPKGRATAASASWAWDHLFGTIPGDHVHLLTSAPNVVHMIKSDGAAGRKWLVTKSVRRNGEAFCWCLPFDAAPGSEERLVLDDANVERLARLGGVA